MHAKEMNKRLFEIISKMTGIPESTIRKYGVPFIFQTPWAVKGMTEQRKQKLEMLQDFVSIWNEVEFLKEEILLNNPENTGKYFINRIGHKKDKEYFETAYLSVSNKIIKIETLSGTISEACIYPRELIKSALAYNAQRILVAHSHPSGSLKPSAADIDVTKRIVDTSKLFGIDVLDHFIVTEKNYFSFRENCLM